MLRANHGLHGTGRESVIGLCVRAEYRERMKLDQRQAGGEREKGEAILLVEVVFLGRAIYSSDEAKIINCNKNLVDKAT